MASKSTKKCVICDRRRSSVSNLFLAALPLDPVRCQQWVQARAIGQEDLFYLPIEKLHELKFVCGNHLTAEDFNKNQNRLLKSAVPKLNLPHPPLADELFVDFPLKICSQKTKFQRAIFSDCTSKVLNQNISQPYNIPTEVKDMPKTVQPTMCMELENLPSTLSSVVETKSLSSDISTTMKYDVKKKIDITDSVKIELKPSTSASADIFVHNYTRTAKSTGGKKPLCSISCAKVETLAQLMEQLKMLEILLRLCLKHILI